MHFVGATPCIHRSACFHNVYGSLSFRIVRDPRLTKKSRDFCGHGPKFLTHGLISEFSSADDHGWCAGLCMLWRKIQLSARVPCPWKTTRLGYGSMRRHSESKSCWSAEFAKAASRALRAHSARAQTFCIPQPGANYLVGPCPSRCQSRLWT